MPVDVYQRVYDVSDLPPDDVVNSIHGWFKFIGEIRIGQPLHVSLFVDEEIAAFFNTETTEDGEKVALFNWKTHQSMIDGVSIFGEETLVFFQKRDSNEIPYGKKVYFILKPKR
jgi:hypothetical protein